jgi:hypothetical protein
MGSFENLIGHFGKNDRRLTEDLGILPEDLGLLTEIHHFFINITKIISMPIFQIN